MGDMEMPSSSSQPQGLDCGRGSVPISQIGAAVSVLPQDSSPDAPQHPPPVLPSYNSYNLAGQNQMKEPYRVVSPALLGPNGETEAQGLLTCSWPTRRSA